MSMLPEVPAERGMNEASPEPIVIVSLKDARLHWVASIAFGQAEPGWQAD